MKVRTLATLLRSRRPDRPYDAFISYAHEDQTTAEWLHRVLSRYWIPGHRRRLVFLDRRSLAAGGVLDEALKRALARSRFLVVCCSGHSASSAYVALEVSEFLRQHSSDKVLACLVGVRAERSVAVPPSVLKIERDRGGELLRPDLRGHSDTLARRDRRRLVEEALSLLAPIAGFSRKDEILDRGRRTRWLLFGAVVLGVGLRLGWQAWLQTDDGARYRAVQDILAAAGHDRTNDPALVDVAVYLGQEGRRSDIERLATLAEDADMAALIRASGYASLPKADCTAVSRELNVLVTKRPASPCLLLDEECWSTFMRAGSSCGPAWPERVLATKAWAGQWTLQMARCGDMDAARRAAHTTGFSARFGPMVEVALAVRAHQSLRLKQDVLLTWERQFPPPLADELVDWGLEFLWELDAFGHLGDVDVAPLLEMTRRHALDEQTVLVGDGRIQLAVHLAGRGRPEQARAILLRFPRGDSDSVAGLVWRGLALERLGDTTASTACYQEARRRRRERTLGASEAGDPAIRILGPLELARAYILANAWRDAFAVADELATPTNRTMLRCRLVDLWSRLRMTNRR